MSPKPEALKPECKAEDWDFTRRFGIQEMNSSAWSLASTVSYHLRLPLRV